ncbi:hypothetical protein [Methylobacterium sp. E-005]|uniref:hypothetical protein n=1 Tax=Methylobacterium sp. E-005 TaxID=2836549 RepID=UPI00391A260C
MLEAANPSLLRAISHRTTPDAAALKDTPMLFRSETPPPPGNLHVAEPPAYDRPTTAMLKADIDSGATIDKVAAYDPGLSQLGTDDEAAGNSPSHERIALARKTETASARVRNAAQPHGGLNSWVIPGFCTTIGGIGAILTLSIWLF